jgi:hypothetical protein
MPYIGKSPSAVGVRNRFYFTASGGETSLSGSDDNGKTLVFSDASYVDVILNGGNLVSGTDYTATPSTNTISGLTALVANDVVEIIAYDVFSVSDTVSAASGGTFQSNVNFDSGIDVTGNATFADNGKAIFGAGSDLQIYHDGGSSWVSDVGAGNLKLSSDGAGVFLQKGATEFMGEFLTDGAVRLYYDNAAKFETTSTGVDVTGTVTADGLTIDTTGIVYSSGNVGIGTSSPSAKLETKVSRTSGANVDAIILSDDVTGVQTSGYGTRIVGLSNNGNAKSAIGFEAFGGTNNDTGLGFYTQAVAGGLTRQMTINSTGNVGIGTTSPTYKLTVEDGTGATRVNVRNTANAGPGSGIFFEVYSGGSVVGNGTIATQSSGDMAFFTGTSSGTERLRITSGGQTYTTQVPPQTIARLTGRYNGAAIEFGHGNNGGGYYGTLGAWGSSGYPYIGFSADGESSLNTFTTRGFKGNLISGDNAGSLIFSQLTNASATGQTPVTRMTIDSSGRVTMPYQPAFSVYRTSNVSSGTYIAHNVTLVNNGNHYNSTNGRFTAPVAGNYMFYATGLTQPTGGTSRMKLFKNGSTTVGGESRHQGGTAGAYLHATIQAVVSMAAGDWVQQFYFNDDGSTTLYSDSTPYVTFGGHLIG